MQKYIDLVVSDSASEGDSFDLQYAVTILTSALTDEVLGWILNPQLAKDPFATNADDEFEYWLSGFNASP